MFSAKKKLSLSIGARIGFIILLSTSITILATITGSIETTKLLNSAKRSYSAAKVSNYVSNLGQAEETFLRYAYANAYHAVKDPTQKRKYIDDVEIAASTIEDNILGLSGEVSSLPEMSADLKSVEARWQTIKPKLAAVVTEASAGKDAALIAGITDAEADLDALHSELNTLNSRLSSVLSEAYGIADRADKISTWLLWISGVVIAFSVAVSIYITRSITKRSGLLLRSANDETGRLLELGTTLSVSSHRLSESSTEQAAAIQESTAAMEQMSSMIKNTSENIQSCSQLSLEVDRKAKQGATTMQEMVNSMQAIEKSNESLNEVSHIIEKISQRTTVINDIVFKTQILSFNASIEAARAGQYGKGFAVVAEEVGKLADSSGSAAKEISMLLGDSQREVKRMLEDTLGRVRDGNTVCRTALTVFNEINGDVQRLVENFSDISRATNEQEVGVKQVTEAMREMDKTSQQNNKIAYDTSNYSNNIKNQSESLGTIMRDFQIVIQGSKAARSTRDPVENEARDQKHRSDSDLRKGNAGSAELSQLVVAIGAGAKSKPDHEKSELNADDASFKKGA